MSTTLTTPETNLQATSDMSNALIREIDFALQFEDGIKRLQAAMGISNMIPVQAGTALKVTKASGTLSNTQPAEGEIIPLSKYKTVATTVAEATLLKYRKATTAEVIVQYGYDQAVNKTTAKMLKDVQAGIRGTFYGYIADNAIAADDYVTGDTVTLQNALAALWGGLQIAFEDTSIEAVYFVNPLDISAYLATASITTQSAFGFSYVENFLGLGTVIITSDVDQGTYFATAKDNLIMYYIPVNGADLGEAFNFTSDESGLVGIHEDADYRTMTAEDVVICGVSIGVERADGVLSIGVETPDAS